MALLVLGGGFHRVVSRPLSIAGECDFFSSFATHSLPLHSSSAVCVTALKSPCFYDCVVVVLTEHILISNDALVAAACAQSRQAIINPTLI